VFKTAYEIDQRAIVDNISVMQKYIDQGISANIFVYGDIDVTALSNLHLEAYEKGMKGLYYTRSQAPFRADVGGTERKTIELEADTCLSCS
jgi:ribonucleoside-diphosphate reductase alpha chain